MRDGFRVSGDVGDEFDEYNEGAEEKENEPEQSQAKDSQGQYSGGLAGAIKERPLARSRNVVDQGDGVDYEGQGGNGCRCTNAPDGGHMQGNEVRRSVGAHQSREVASNAHGGPQQNPSVE
jgi:hypothetical protein